MSAGSDVVVVVDVVVVFANMQGFPLVLIAHLLFVGVLARSENSSAPEKSSPHTRECADLHGSALRICGAVQANENSENKGTCTPGGCKVACCHAARQCNSSILSHSMHACITENMQHQHGDCCTIAERKGVTRAYASGILGVLIMCGGLYFLVSTNTNNDVIHGEQPLEEEETKSKLYQVKAPHLEAEKLMATDADDAFWEDDEDEQES